MNLVMQLFYTFVGQIQLGEDLRYLTKITEIMFSFLVDVGVGPTTV